LGDLGRRSPPGGAASVQRDQQRDEDGARADIPITVRNGIPTTDRTAQRDDHGEAAKTTELPGRAMAREPIPQEYAVEDVGPVPDRMNRP